jgi:hypothetical protein
LAGTLDLSGFAYLTKVDCTFNSLTGIVVNEALEELSIRFNQIKLSGLPLVDNFTYWIYNAQVHNPISVKYNETVDFSGETTINGKETVFLWSKSGDSVTPIPLEENVDYTNNNGVFTFINPDLIGKQLGCVMSNENFPDTYVTYPVSLTESDAPFTHQGFADVYFAGNFLPSVPAKVNLVQEEDDSYTLTLISIATNPNTLIFHNVILTETGDGKASLSSDYLLEENGLFIFLSSGEIDTQNNTLNIDFFGGTTAENVYWGGIRVLFRTEGFYGIISVANDNGGVTSDKGFAVAGETVTLTITPAAGYELESLKVEVRAINNPDISVIEVIDNQFIMPENNVVVTATFKEKIPVSLTQPVSALASITTQSLQIIVSNTNENVNVYSTSGQLVASGVGAGSYAVPQAGVYVIKVGEMVRKVVVRP